MIYWFVKKTDKKSVISSFGNKNKRWIENSVTHAENRIIEFLNWDRLWWIDSITVSQKC